MWTRAELLPGALAHEAGVKFATTLSFTSTQQSLQVVCRSK